MGFFTKEDFDKITKRADASYICEDETLKGVIKRKIIIIEKKKSNKP